MIIVILMMIVMMTISILLLSLKWISSVYDVNYINWAAPVLVCLIYLNYVCVIGKHHGGIMTRKHFYSNAELWSIFVHILEQAVNQIPGLPVLWDAMMLMWYHHNDNEWKSPRNIMVTCQWVICKAIFVHQL